MGEQHKRNTQGARLIAMPVFQSFTPRHIAGAIRSLDSRLLAIDLCSDRVVPVLVYTFQLAGGIQTFQLAAPQPVVTSIRDLYPDAAVFEEHIASASGLVFKLHLNQFLLDGLQS